jgi:hypothetical protein
MANLIHRSTKLSNCRQTRVFGVADDNFSLLNSENHEFVDDSIMITDVLCTIVVNKRDNSKFFAFFSVTKIIVGSELRQMVDLDLINDCSFCGTLLVLTNWDTNAIYWEGLYHNQGLIIL